MRTQASAGEPVLESLRSWPGEERRDPVPSDPHYLVRKPLIEALVALAERLPSTGRRARILDLGCGVKPFYPVFAEHSSEYKGVDVSPGPYVDQVGAAERLDFEEDRFELVLCTQALEHVEDPVAVLREINRVLVPGGTAFVSTHGVSTYHPDPKGSEHDYWRWTHSGLTKIFASAADWLTIDVVPQGNTVACIGYVLAVYADEARQQIRPEWLGRGLVTAVNRGAEFLDARFPPNARFPEPGYMSVNYAVTAVKSPG